MNHEMYVQVILLLFNQIKNFRGHWKLAQVCRADKSRDGKVRSVTLRYKQQGKDNTYKGVVDTEIKRSVHRLVLILPVEEQIGVEKGEE